MKILAQHTSARWTALLLGALVAFEPVACAQQYEEAGISQPETTSAQAQRAFSQPELDQMLAPIALYPDPLLSQILMASTYPLEVVEAARWSRANPSLTGDNAVRAVQQMDWDLSVKSLVAFPQILQMMDEKLEWTERLGDAFLAQQAQVMATVQNLRQHASAAGNLRSNEQIRVEPQGQVIVLAPANPQIIYVPYYDPTVVYGTWWWPAYPPIYWAPWPGYYASGFGAGFAWGAGVTIGVGFFFGNFDWPHHHINVMHINNYYFNRDLHDRRNVLPPVISAPGAWQHNPAHRRGVPYRETSVRRLYGRESAAPDRHREFRGFEPVSPADHGNSGSGPRPPVAAPRALETRPNASGGQAARPYERTERNEHSNPSRQSVPTLSRPPAVHRPPALEDIGRGANVRDYSSRGRASQEGSVHPQTGAPVRRPPENTPGGREWRAR